MDGTSDYNPVDRIAIIGAAGRFPSARTTAKLWKLLAEGRTGTRWFTEEELLAEGVTAAELADPDYVRAGNVVQDMDCFDAEFFGFSPREASILDPQHRHFMETSWEALEDAGHMPENFDGRVGVFAGSGFQAYFALNILTNPELVENVGMFLLRHTGNDKDFMPTRVSYTLNLQGPSVAVQTACSTSLVAVHQAAASLMAGECDMALAGGVSIDMPHNRGYKFAEGEILSPDGRCCAFDENSKGTIFGSGSAVVVLRRLEDAIADGDDIRAVLLASAINNDGSQKAGYLAPSVDGQAEAAAEALAVADIDPATVSYVEAHGTGTPVGDPIELAALSQVYGDGGSGFCGIGSIKTNIGHLDTAAGAASLIKVMAAMRHETIPASLHYETPNSRFDIANSPFYVVDKAQEWRSNGLPRRAAINSLGVGGTNAHAIIEEPPARAPSLSSDVWRLFPLSARSKDSVNDLTGKWREFLDEGPDDLALSDAAHTLRHGRRHFETRRVLVARSRDDLRAAVVGDAPRRVADGIASAANPGVVFMFPGGGAQYPGAGRDLLDSAPVFAKAVEDCFAVMPADVPSDLRELMFERTADDEQARRTLERPVHALASLFVLEYAYAQLWLSWGVKPTAIIGHSAGEYAGAVVAGTLSLKDALTIVYNRGALMEAVPEGAMTAVPATEETVLELAGSDLDIAALNAPDLSVVSGTVDQIAELEAKLAGTEQEARRLHINVAAHSRMLDPELAGFQQKLAPIDFAPPNVPFISTLRGDWGDAGDFTSPAYWVEHLRNTVRFGEAMQKLLEKPDQILLEVGPGQSLGALANMNPAEHRPLAVIASTRHPKEADDDLAFALTSAAKLWANGGELDWDALPGGTEGRRVPLPTYAFEKRSHWIEPGQGARAAVEADAPEASTEIARIDGVENWFETPSWRQTPLPPPDMDRDAKWLVFAGDDPVSRAVLDRLAARGADVTVVRAASEFARTDDGYALPPSDLDAFGQLFEALGDVPAQMLNLWPLGADSADRVFDAAFGLARALQTVDLPDNAHLLLAGAGAASVRGEPVLNPEHATLLGPVRVGAREINGLATQFVDLEAVSAEAADQLLAEADAHAREDQVAYRGGVRMTPSLVRAETAKSDLPSKLKDGGRYLITGGAGGIGLALARWLGETRKAKLGLISRSIAADRADWDTIVSNAPRGAEAEAIRAAREIEAAGGEVMFLGADVTDSDSLQAATAKFTEVHGGVDGVIHGAGVINDSPMAMKTLEDAHGVLAPKLTGGRNLSTLFAPGSLDFFAVFSSSSVVIAPPGQVDYVGANAYLEALAASRPDGVSIAWGVWSDIGMAAKAYGGVDEAGPHPLLGPKTLREDGGVEFVGRYDPTALWTLFDHVVGGVKVLPGTAYVEIAAAAAKAAEPDTTHEIRTLSLALPMAFPGDLPRLVRVRMEPVDEGFDLRIESAPSPDAPFMEHSRARVIRRRRADVKPPKELKSFSGLKAVDLDAHKLSEDLIQFGPRWKNIDQIRTGEAGAEADLTLPAEFAGDLEAYPAHPGLVDMAATIGLYLLPSPGESGAIYAPVSMDRVRILGPLTQKLKARARIVSETPGQMAVFDAVLMDEREKPLMVFEGFSMRRVDPSALANSKAAENSLTDMMLARGIREADAPEIFNRAFGSDHGAMVVSSLSLATLRRTLTLATGGSATARSRKPRAEDAGTAADYANTVERTLAGFWSELLGVDGVQPQDDFFDLGGHSLAAVRLFARIRKEWNVDLPLTSLFEASRLRPLSDMVISEGGIEVTSTAAEAGEETKPAKREWSPLVRIKKGTDALKPLYCVHPAGGNVLHFKLLGDLLDDRLPFYGLQAKGADGIIEPDRSIEVMADRYLEAVLKEQSEGPFRLAGYSGGGVIAYDMAQKLKAMGHEVETIVMFDTLAPHVPDLEKQETKLQKIWSMRKWKLINYQQKLKRVMKKFRGDAEDKALRAQIDHHIAEKTRMPPELLEIHMSLIYMEAQEAYEAAPYDGDLIIFGALTKGNLFLRGGRELGWQDLTSGERDVYEVDCNHFTMLEEPTVSEIAEVLNDALT